MQTIINLLLLAYTMEGIKASDVAILVSLEGGQQVFRCMCPQQHHARRAIDIKKRAEKQLSSYLAEIHVQPGRVFHGEESQTMHTVVVVTG